MVSLASKLRAKARAALPSAKEVLERQKAKQSRERAKAELNQLAPNGFSPEMHAKLQAAAAKGMESAEYQKARAKVIAARRIEDAHVEHGLHRPATMYGIPIDDYDKLEEGQMPESMEEYRARQKAEPVEKVEDPAQLVEHPKPKGRKRRRR